MNLPKLNIIPWWLKLLVPVGVVILLVLIVVNWWGNVKTNITHKHEDYVDLVANKRVLDSLYSVNETKLAKTEFFLLQRDSTIQAFKEREAVHQRNNYELVKKLGVYRRDNRVCYRRSFLGKDVEIPCKDVNLNSQDPP